MEAHLRSHNTVRMKKVKARPSFGYIYAFACLLPPFVATRISLAKWINGKRGGRAAVLAVRSNVVVAEL